jgi:A/G-specific adenine glycosylase
MAQLSTLLLDWYKDNARELPWRAPFGSFHDPYYVWMSEIMLQQTTVAAVIPYFAKFTRLWPTVEDLAAAEDEAVMAAWAGLGYYARVRNLLKCARVVTDSYDGRFPDEEAILLSLPGIGPYTAAAVAAIAFGRAANVVDGNVERVMARVHRVQEVLPQAKATLKAHAATHVPMQHCGEYAQALMDLGATICTPKKPACLVCPLKAVCAAFACGDAADYPRKAAKKPQPTRYGVAFVVRDAAGNLLLLRRPKKGLLGGMLGFPSTPWREKTVPYPEAGAYVGQVVHVFTHFRLQLDVVTLTPDQMTTQANMLEHDISSPVWVAPAQVLEVGLPTVMKKIAALLRT